jgi:hypothetical protein
MLDAPCICQGFKIASCIVGIREGAAVGGDFLCQIAESVVGVLGIDIAGIGYLGDLI